MSGAGKGRPQGQHYEVGYGKPPVATRFKPGVSGNPRGRPKGAKTVRSFRHEDRLKRIIRDEAARQVEVREGDRLIRMPVMQAVVGRLAVAAAQGKPREQKLFLELAATVEAADAAEHRDLLETAIAYKVGWEQELARRREQGLTGPEPLPHPDDVVVDLDTGEVAFTGPRTPQEKAAWDALRGERGKLKALREDLMWQLENERSRTRRQSLESTLQRVDRILDLYRAVLGDV